MVLLYRGGVENQAISLLISFMISRRQEEQSKANPVFDEEATVLMSIGRGGRSVIFLVWTSILVILCASL